MERAGCGEFASWHVYGMRMRTLEKSKVLLQGCALLHEIHAIDVTPPPLRPRHSVMEQAGGMEEVEPVSADQNVKA